MFLQDAYLLLQLDDGGFDPLHSALQLVIQLPDAGQLQTHTHTHLRSQRSTWTAVLT